MEISYISVSAVRKRINEPIFLAFLEMAHQSVRPPENSVPVVDTMENFDVACPENGV